MHSRLHNFPNLLGSPNKLKKTDTQEKLEHKRKYTFFILKFNEMQKNSILSVILGKDVKKRIIIK